MTDPAQTPRRRRRPQQPAPPAQGSVGRGAVLVLLAVVIGIVLLRDDADTVVVGPVGADTADTTDDTTDADGDDGTTDTTTPTAVRPASQVKVLVANGSEVNGAAGAQTDALQALGYVTGTPANAERVAATVVYYTAGYEAEARVLAEAIGAAPTSIALLPAVAPVDDMQLANLLVVLGPDLASAG